MFGFIHHKEYRRMNKRIITIATTVVAVLALGGAASAVDNAKEVRQADFITSLGAGSQGEADVRAKGHYEFLEEGLHVWTDSNDSASKVAEYFTPRDSATEIPATYTQDWYGTTPEPGKQVVFDTNDVEGDAGSYNILVGEPVYGDDWWYTGGSAKAATNGVTCPSNTGGSGSDCHGTLTEFRDANPDARVYALGFSLGSGVKGDGVIRAQKVGYGTPETQDEYVFTDETEAPATTPEAHTVTKPVYASGAWDNSNRVLRFKMTSINAAANDTMRGTKVSWSIKVDGSTRFASTQGWGEVENFIHTFPASDPNHKVQVYRNGALYSTRTVTTN